MPGDCPVDHVFGFQNDHSGRHVLFGGNHVIRIAQLFHIHIRIIGIQDRIFVCSVTLIAPTSGMLLLRIGGCKNKKRNTQQELIEQIRIRKFIYIHDYFYFKTSTGLLYGELFH